MSCRAFEFIWVGFVTQLAERVRDRCFHVRLTRDVGDPCRVVREAHYPERFGFPVAR